MFRATSTTPWPFFRSARTGSNLSSRTQSSSAFSRRNLILPRESRQKLGSPDVGHPSIQCQPAGSGIYAFGDVDIANVQRVFSFNPPCRENRGGAIYLEFIFGVVKYLDPRLVSREPFRVGDTIIQVGKWPLTVVEAAGGGVFPRLLEWAHRGRTLACTLRAFLRSGHP